MNALRFVVICTLSLLCVTAQANPGQASSGQSQKKTEISAKELKERIRRYQALPKAERDKLRQRWRSFSQLSPEQQRQLRRRFRSLCHKRKDFKHRARSMQRMSSSERSRIHSRHKKYKALIHKLSGQLSAADKQRLATMSPHEKWKYQQNLVRSYVLSRKIDDMDLFDEKTRGKLKRQVSALDMRSQFETVRRESKRHEVKFNALFDRHFGKHRGELGQFMESLRNSEADSDMAEQKLRQMAQKLAPHAPAGLIRHFTRRFRKMHHRQRRYGKGGHYKRRKFGHGKPGAGERGRRSRRGKRGAAPEQSPTGEGNMGPGKSAGDMPNGGKMKGPKAGDKNRGQVKGQIKGQSKGSGRGSAGQRSRRGNRGIRKSLRSLEMQGSPSANKLVPQRRRAIKGRNGRQSSKPRRAF